MAVKFTDKSGKIFTVTSKTALLEENEKGQPVLEETVKTFKVNRFRKKFFVRELGRKNSKPKAVKTLRAKKGMTISTIIEDIKLGKIQINAKHINKRDTYSTEIKDNHVKRTKTGSIEVVQTNYLSKINFRSQGLTIKIKPQMVGLVRITDHSTGISDHFVGYSKKMRSSRPSPNDLANAEDEVKLMAVGKFLEKHDSAKFKATDYKQALTFFEAEIIEKRFQYWKTRRLGK